MDTDSIDEVREEETGGGSQKVIMKADKLSTIHMVAFILTAVMGRQYSLWQPALSQGFGQFMIAEILMAVTFINTYFCFAEIWSAVPFSGGLYGLARAMMGFYPGFLVGCGESFIYIVNSANGATFLATQICTMAGINQDYSILFVVMVYAVAVGLCNNASLVTVRRSFLVLAAVSVTILLIFLFGSLRDTDFHANASLHRSEVYSAPENWFSGGMSTFMLWLPHASLPYAGVKSFTLMSAVTDTPKVTIPRAVSIAVPFIFGLNMFVVFVNAAQPGGILHSAAIALPVATGYIRMFDVAASHIHHLMDLLTFPATFGMLYAYMIPSGTLLQSLGRTNLLPSVLRLNHNRDHCHGTVITAIFGFCMCLVKHYEPRFDLFSLSIIVNCFTNAAMNFSYIKLVHTCPTLERGFVNPVGTVGSVYAFLMFVMMFISAAFFQENYSALIAAVVLLIVLSAYYWGLGVQHQTLCKEEDKVFLMLHVKNFNKNKKRNSKRSPRTNYNNKVQVATGREQGHSSGGNSETHSSANGTVERSVSGFWSNLFRNNVVFPTSFASTITGRSVQHSSSGPASGGSVMSSARLFPGASVTPEPDSKPDSPTATGATDVTAREVEMAQRAQLIVSIGP